MKHSVRIELTNNNVITLVSVLYTTVQSMVECISPSMNSGNKNSPLNQYLITNMFGLVYLFNGILTSYGLESKVDSFVNI